MSRRKMQFFNLSFLDLMTGALGAIIFLFIITPKGGESAAPVRQAAIYVDTVQRKLYGDLPDSLLNKEAGDTLLPYSWATSYCRRKKKSFPGYCPRTQANRGPEKGRACEERTKGTEKGNQASRRTQARSSEARSEAAGLPN
jgi:hypothetical protein